MELVYKGLEEGRMELAYKGLAEGGWMELVYK